MKRQRLRRMGVGLVAVATIGLAACETLPASQKEVGTLTGGRFGQTVALSGNGLVMAVGSPSTTEGGVTKVGRVQVFERDAESLTFALAETIVSPNTWATQYFGSALDLDYTGTTLAVGAPSELGALTGAAGRAYVYTRSGQADEFILASTLVPTPEIGQRFGTAIALDRNAKRLAVGAPRATVGSQTSAGSVYIYDTPIVGLGGAVSWTKRTNVTDLIPQGSNSASGAAWFGNSVDLDDAGEKLIVGAPYYNAVASNDGLARVYTWAAATSSFAGAQPVPVQVNAGDPDIRGTSAYFGFDVAISGDGKTVVVGIPNRDSGKGGAITATYNATSASWVAVSAMKPTTAAEGAGGAGSSVDLNADGSRAVIGIPLLKNASNVETGWVALTNPLTGTKLYAGDLADFTSGDDVGRSVVISDAGDVFVAGAPAHGSSAGFMAAYNTIAVPSAPRDAAGLALNGAAVVRWKSPANASADVRNAYVVTNVTTGATCRTTFLSCSFTGLTNGTTYDFKIIATNPKGETPDAQAAKVSVAPFNWAAVGSRPIALPDFADLLDASLINDDGTIKGGVTGGTGAAAGDAVPAPPTGVVAVAGRRRITVSWGAPAAGGQPILSHTVTVTSPKGSKTCTAESGATSCVIGKLGDNKAYTVSVTATNVFGTGNATTVASRVWTQPKISRGTGATLKHLSRHAGLPAGKNASVTVSLRGAVAKANCSVVNGRVFAKASGPCKVRIISKVGITTSRKIVVLRAVR